MPGKYLDQFLTDQPIKFEFDPDTGLVSLDIRAGYSGLAGPANQTDQGATLYMPVRVMLTPESALALLNDLPTVAAILARSKEGITRPDFLQ